MLARKKYRILFNNYNRKDLLQVMVQKKTLTKIILKENAEKRQMNLYRRGGIKLRKRKWMEEKLEIDKVSSFPREVVLPVNKVKIKYHNLDEIFKIKKDHYQFIMSLINSIE